MSFDFKAADLTTKEVARTIIGLYVQKNPSAGIHPNSLIAIAKLWNRSINPPSKPVQAFTVYKQMNAWDAEDLAAAKKAEEEKKFRATDATTIGSSPAYSSSPMTAKASSPAIAARPVAKSVVSPTAAAVAPAPITIVTPSKPALPSRDFKEAQLLDYDAQLVDLFTSVREKEGATPREIMASSSRAVAKLSSPTRQVNIRNDLRSNSKSALDLIYPPKKEEDKTDPLTEEQWKAANEAKYSDLNAEALKEDLLKAHYASYLTQMSLGITKEQLEITQAKLNIEEDHHETNMNANENYSLAIHIDQIRLMDELKKKNEALVANAEHVVKLNLELQRKYRLNLAYRQNVTNYGWLANPAVVNTQTDEYKDEYQKILKKCRPGGKKENLTHEKIASEILKAELLELSHVEKFLYSHRLLHSNAVKSYAYRQVLAKLMGPVYSVDKLADRHAENLAKVNAALTKGIEETLRATHMAPIAQQELIEGDDFDPEDPNNLDDQYGNIHSDLPDEVWGDDMADML